MIFPSRNFWTWVSINVMTQLVGAMPKYSKARAQRFCRPNLAART